MDAFLDRRDSRRIFLGPDHSIHFLVKGHAFRDVRITNLSLGGCFAMVSQRDRDLFVQGAVLEQVGFDHPDLPRGLLTAQVRYAVGATNGPEGLDFLGIGVGFVAMAPETQERLALFIRAAG